MELFYHQGGWRYRFFRWAEMLRFYREIYGDEEVEALLPTAAKSSHMSIGMMRDVSQLIEEETDK
jgi:hypothetical protein